jgi:hypothetical protein
VIQFFTLCAMPTDTPHSSKFTHRVHELFVMR